MESVKSRYEDIQEEKSMFKQLCVWPGVQLHRKNENDEVEKLTWNEFENWISQEFDGVRIKMVEEVTTLPDMENGQPVPETGGRNDLFFYVHNDDIMKFAVRRLQSGIRWWEDVLGNGNGVLYNQDVLNRYPKTW